MTFEEELVSLMPRLKIYALSLTRDVDRAGDLLQSTMLQTLENRSKFQVGTNMAAWVFTIQRNLFISNIRRTRPHVDITDIVLSKPAAQEDGIRTRELVRWLSMMPPKTRNTLLLVGEEIPYEEIAVLTKTTLGTVKSRVSRARDILGELL